MNKRQKLVQQQFINDEEAVIRRLKSVYNQALKDITKKSEELQNSINALTMATMHGEMTEEEKVQLQSMIQSKVYQKQYQDALKKQVSSILDNMQVEEFKTVSEYLQKCYEEGFLGTMYDLQGQGIPLVFPMDQESIVRAIQLDSKISKGLYSRLGEDVTLLKRKITATVSRGISTGMTFQQMAQQLSGYTSIGFNNAVRIARTEGHRIQVQSGNDALYKAKDKGADVVKQWDSTLDKRTRPSHQKVDGEVKELDEPFSNGLMFPGDPAGGAGEVVNCRCALLQRARWALDDDELATLKERAEYFGLDKAEDFDDFKKKYLKATKEGFATEKALNKNGDEIIFDLSGKKPESQEEVVKTITELSSKYDTNLIEVRTGADSFGKNREHADLGGYSITISVTSKKETVVHEFAHTLASTKAEKYGLQDNKAFWKEMRGIHREYKKDILRNGNIEFALDADGYAENIDEFLAEGFTAAYLGDESIDDKYPRKIMDIVIKYFGK